jgi:hypothetical protein
MEQTRPVTPTPERDEKPITREEPKPRTRLKIEALEARIAPTNGGSGGGGTGGWPL